MRAAVLTALNAPLLVDDVDPLPLSFGQVSVKLLVAGICGAQLQEIRGEKGGPLPHLMGHEGAGIVQAIGPGVSRVKPGDKVCLHWRKAAGLESDFPRYRSPRLGEFSSGLVTTWAEQTNVSENRLTPIPADTDPALASLLGCALSTALGTIESEVRRMGQRILIVGVGGLGTCLLGAIDYARASRVCACDVHEAPRATAEEAGADFHNLSKEPFPSGPFDVVLDTAGHEETMERALEHLAPSGRYVMIGQPRPGKPVFLRNARHLFDGEGKTITATQGGGFRPDIDLPRFLPIAKKLPISKIITHVFRLEEINHAISLVRFGAAGRVLIDFQ